MMLGSTHHDAQIVVELLQEIKGADVGVSTGDLPRGGQAAGAAGQAGSLAAAQVDGQPQGRCQCRAPGHTIPASKM